MSLRRRQRLARSRKNLPRTRRCRSCGYRTSRNRRRLQGWRDGRSTADQGRAYRHGAATRRLRCLFSRRLLRGGLLWGGLLRNGLLRRGHLGGRLRHDGDSSGKRRSGHGARGSRLRGERSARFEGRLTRGGRRRWPLRRGPKTLLDNGLVLLGDGRFLLGDGFFGCLDFGFLEAVAVRHTPGVVSIPRRFRDRDSIGRDAPSNLVRDVVVD